MLEDEVNTLKAQLNSSKDFEKIRLKLIESDKNTRLNEESTRNKLIEANADKEKVLVLNNDLLDENEKLKLLKISNETMLEECK